MADSGGVVVKVVRPLKLIGSICGCIGVVLILLSVATCHWLEAKDFHQGLWRSCVENEDSETCEFATGKDWLIICLALCSVALILGVVSVILSVIGLCRMKRSNHGVRSVFSASSVMAFLAVLSLLAAVILFPIMFIRDIEDYHTTYKILHWYFSWSYGIAWGACIFMFGSGILLALKGDTYVGDHREKNGHPIHSS